MAISNLVSPGKKIDLPGVSGFFGTQQRSANDNVQKISSTMLSDSMVSSVIETLKVFTSEIGRLQETSQNIVRSFVGLIKSFKGLNRDINNRFKTLSSDLTASRLEFVRNVMTGVPAGTSTAKTLEEKFPPIPGAPTKEEPKKEDDKPPFDIIDALMNALGIAGLAKGPIIKALGGLITLLATPAGALAFLTVVGGVFLYKGLSDLTKNIMEDPAFKEMQERDKNKTEQQMREEVAKRIAERNNPERRQMSAASREEALKSILKPNGKPLGGGDVTGFTTNDKGEEVIIFKPDVAKEVGFAALNRITGERYLSVETTVPGRFRGTAMSSAQPAGALDAVKSSTDTASSAAAGAGEGGAGLNVVPAGERVGSPTPAPAAPAPEAAPTGAPTPAAPAGGGGAAPTPAPAGAPARTSTGGEPLNTTTAQHWMLNHPEVAAAYAALSPSDKKKAAEIAAAGQESEARNFVMSKGSAPKTQMPTGGAQTVQGTESQGAPAGTPAAAPAATTPPAPPETPAPPAAGGGAPVVVNNNSSQASESASNTEGNNVAGQNFPMFVVDPFVQSYIQRVTPHYQ